MNSLARPARGVQRRARSRLRGRAVPAGGLAPPALCSRSEACSGQSENQERNRREIRRANALQLWVRIFARYRTEQRAIAGPRAFNGLCDDEGVPLICPTCQVFSQSASVPATACYFAWGCFRYFWLGAMAIWRRDIRLEAAHTVVPACAGRRIMGVTNSGSPRRRAGRNGSTPRLERHEDRHTCDHDHQHDSQLVRTDAIGETRADICSHPETDDEADDREPRQRRTLLHVKQSCGGG